MEQTEFPILKKESHQRLDHEKEEKEQKKKMKLGKFEKTKKHHFALNKCKLPTNLTPAKILASFTFRIQPFLAHLLALP